MTDKKRASTVRPRPGLLDQSFDPVVSGRVDHVVAMPGRVIVSGGFSEIDGVERRSIAGLTTQGEVDARFDVAPALVGNTLLRQDADQLYVDAGGSFYYPPDSKDHFGGLLRLASNGSLDTDFNPLAHGISVTPTAVLPIPGGLLVAGSLYNVNPQTHQNGIFKLADNGQYDPSFQFVKVEAVTDMALTEQNRLIVGGHFRTINDQPHAKLAVLDTGGELIAQLNGPGLSPDRTHFVHRILPDPEGGYVVCGRLGEINGVYRRGIARIYADGTIAPDYGAEANDFNHAVLAMVRQSDDKLIVGGEFSWVGNQRRDKIARLERDGTLDTSFNSGTVDHPVSGLALQESPRGRSLIAVGSFWRINGVDQRFIARIHAGDRSILEEEDTPEEPDQGADSGGGKKTPTGDLPSFGGDPVGKS